MFDFYFWKATDPSQLDKCLTPLNFFSYLFICILFNAFMQQIPELIDALAASGLMPLSSLYHGATHRLEQNIVYQRVSSWANQARAMLPHPSMIFFAPPAAQILEMGTGVFNTATQRFDHAVGGRSGAPNTQILDRLRDAVGRQLVDRPAALLPQNRGIFETEYRDDSHG